MRGRETLALGRKEGMRGKAIIHTMTSFTDPVQMTTLHLHLGSNWIHGISLNTCTDSRHRMQAVLANILCVLVDGRDQSNNSEELSVQN